MFQQFAAPTLAQKITSRRPRAAIAALLFSALLGAGAAHAQNIAPLLGPDAPLTLEQAVALAVKTHPSVRGAAELVQQSESGVDAARAAYKPQISGGIENQINSYRNSSHDSRIVSTATLKGSQMLYDFGKTRGEVMKARSAVRASAAQAELATDEISVSTAQAWIDLHLQQILVLIARDQLDAVQAITALVAERVSKGATSRSDIAQAHSRVEAVRSQLLGIEADALRASLTLMHLTGRTAPVSIHGDIPALLRGAACDIAADDSAPAVRIAGAQRDGAKADLAIANAQRFPTISLDGSVGQALTNGSRLYGDYGTTGQIGFNVAMPLYQGGGVQARQRAATHQLRRSEEAVLQAQLEMRQGFAAAKAQRDGWSRRAPVLQNRVESINATRDLYKQQYLYLGTRTLIDLLNSEQEFSSARVEQAQGEHLQYRLALECLYFSDGLNRAFGSPHDEGAR